MAVTLSLSVVKLSFYLACFQSLLTQGKPTEAVGAMFGRLNGVVFALLLFLTSYLGSIFMLFPLLPFAYYGSRIWRVCADRLVGYWLTFPAVRCFSCCFYLACMLELKIGAKLCDVFTH